MDADHRPSRPDRRRRWIAGRLSLASTLLDATAEPIVRRLLLLAELQRHHRSASAAAGRGDGSSEELETLRHEKELLALLRGALDGVAEKADGSVEGQQRGAEQEEEQRRCAEAAQKIGRQLNGAAVPLLEILQRHHNQQQQGQQQEQLRPVEVHERRRRLILRSAEYACVEEAALALKSTWRLLRRSLLSFELNIESGEDDGEGEAGSATGMVANGIRSFVLPSLISCAMALTSLDVANENDGGDGDGGDDCHDGSEGDIEATRKGAEKALDRGEDCAAAILACVRSFFLRTENVDAGDDGWLLSSIQNNDEGGNDADDDDLASVLAEEVGSAMGGALVARLVQGCLSLLPSGGDGEDSTAQERRGGRKIRPMENTSLQLDALATMRALMRGVPSKELWGSILPGCFAGLYRTALSKLRYASAASSYRVGSACVAVLALLLKQSLGHGGASNDGMGQVDVVDASDDGVRSITASLMAAVKLSGDHGNVDVASAPDSSLPPEDKKRQELVAEANKRLLGPLSVLLSLLSANRAGAVRRSGLDLCRVILIDTRHVWSESNTNALGRKALEYCLATLSDDDDAISCCSRQILLSFRSHLGTTCWKRQLGQRIAPAILELVEVLPAFARSGREADLRNHLRLINGYLLVSFRGMDRDFDVQECLVERRKSDIGSALACSEAVEVLKRSFAVLFAPDVNSISSSPMIEDSASAPNAVAVFQRSDGCRFLYLRDEAITATKTTVHLFARALGAKRCAFVVDTCIADVFESCSRSRDDDLLISEALNQRMQWSGMCVFATELLGGLHEQHGSSKHLRILSSLASSVLPAVVADPLWTLLTVVEMHSEAIGTHSGPERRNAGHTAAQSVTFLHSNAILISVLMGFIRQLSQSLGDSIQLHLPTILLPLLERASPVGNHSSVQRAAFSSLWEISLCIGHKDVSSLLASNVDYLMDAISLRLHKYAREQSPMERPLMGVVDVILQSLVHHGGTESNEDNENMPSVTTHAATVGHMLTRLLNHFDRQPYMSRSTLLDTVGVFRSMCVFMDASVDAYIGRKYMDRGPKSPEVEKDQWLDRLDFELKVEAAGYEDVSDCTNGILNEPTAVKEAEPTSEDQNIDSANKEEASDFAQEIAAINSILQRCCYLLGYEHLRLQMLCCDTILCGFQSLGKIGAFRKSIHGESASNPLLPAIAEYWPSIVARIRSASTSLASVNRISWSDLSIRHAIAADQQAGPSKTSLELLISKLLLIVSTLCSSSDGFFVDRFENDVFPTIAGLIQDFHSEGSRGRPTSIAQQKHCLLVSILDCFKCTYESGCKHGLSGLIPAAGTMLFPLLSLGGTIGDASVAALKAMLAVDCEGLWRGLHKLSGRSFPCNPICSSRSIPSSNSPKSIIAVDSSENLLSRKAGELLDFIGEILEQPI